VSPSSTTGLRPRRLLTGALGVGAGAALTACTSNAPQGSGAPPAGGSGVSAPSGNNAAPGRPVTIGFSAPAADHGWIAAIAKNAQAQAGQYSDVTFQPVNPTNDITQQIAAVETSINKKVDALVILPNDGSQLTSLGRRAMAAGIPVINPDPIFDTPLAYRTWIGGDNYGMGASAGNYIGNRLKSTGAGSGNAMRAIQADNTVLKATVTYSPTMASSAVALARLVAQRRGMSDLVEKEVPASITLASATVTKDNVAEYLPLGFES
jgi:ribose transport system substrate-binding protein